MMVLQFSSGYSQTQLYLELAKQAVQIFVSGAELY